MTRTKILNNDPTNCNDMSWVLVKKIVLISIGCVLIAISPFIGIVPGPGGIPVAGAGLILILSQSNAAKRTFLRYHRRYPQTVGPLRRFIQRRKNRSNRSPENE